MLYEFLLQFLGGFENFLKTPIISHQRVPAQHLLHSFLSCTPYRKQENTLSCLLKSKPCAFSLYSRIIPSSDTSLRSSHQAFLPIPHRKALTLSYIIVNPPTIDRLYCRIHSSIWQSVLPSYPKGLEREHIFRQYF